MKYVLDTDILIDILRGFEPAVEWFSTLAGQPAVISLSVMELVQGCRSKQQLSVVAQLVAPLEIWYPNEAEMQEALKLFRENYLKCRLSVIDAVIGGVCVARKAVLCTFNLRHYRCIPELETLQPYPRSLSGI